MRECLIIPTYRRTHFLHCTLERIRKQDERIEIAVFSDRGEDSEELFGVTDKFEATLKITPAHNYYGNSFCIMEAYRWAYNEGYDLVHFSEDDVMQHPGCLEWHRSIHEMLDNIFCSCGWVFNQHAPITEDLMFAPWFYSPNACFRRDKLGLVVKHANPLYYNDMQGYVLKTFKNSSLHNKGRQRETKFFEQDAIVQYAMEQDKSQAAWCATAKVDHVGTSGYNKPDGLEFTGTLAERIEQVEKLIADHYLRADIFSRAIVEREIGHVLPKRMNKYRVRLPGGWESDYFSELQRDQLPRKINSVSLGPDAVVESVS